MSSDFVLCDVFAERPFTGNPLAVFFEADATTDAEMAALAVEFGWSEITFVSSPDGEPGRRVRIWTPYAELPFAGHPTVGTAVALVATGRARPGAMLLRLGVGPVAVDVELSGPASGFAAMTQGSPSFGPIVEDREAVAAAVGVPAADLAPGLPVQLVSTGLPHLLVPVASLAALTSARGVAGSFAAVSEAGARWAYLFCVDTPASAAAARARLLAPGMEDAATGSAAGPLGAYLVQYGLHRAGAMDIEQGIEMGRPSRIEVNVTQEGGEIGPVRVGGEVHIWARGARQDGP